MVRLPRIDAPRRKIISRDNPSAVEIVAETIDDIAEGIIGGRPAERILRLVTHIAPAPVFERITGLPAPGKVIDSVLDKIADSVEQVEARVFPGYRKAKETEREILE